MALRTFRSSAGVPWQVWSVIPGIREGEERRRGYDRRSPDPVLRYTGPERRGAPDRRKTARLLASALAAGWLVFESPSERRRLFPIPPAWDACSDAQLERWCERAMPVAKDPPPADGA
ncbi:MAG TPA: hypothetical protein VHG91_13940 [Longimicrobium sp.]|nr:hypothetical protein [Longimicrobium sp.]